MGFPPAGHSRLTVGSRLADADDEDPPVTALSLFEGDQDRAPVRQCGVRRFTGPAHESALRWVQDLAL